MKSAYIQVLKTENELFGQITNNAIYVSCIIHLNFIFMVTVCFDYDSSYYPKDLPGHGISVEPDSKACQLRCTNVEGCSYFSFWPNEKSCHLSGPAAKKIFDKWGAVSGPKRCDECKLTY